MKAAHEIVCSGRFGTWMRGRRWAGLTLPLPWPWLAVVFYWGPPTPGTRVHEAVHVEQIRRLGRLRFIATYLWGLRRGYRRNPLEVEAYAVQKAVKETR